METKAITFFEVVRDGLDEVEARMRETPEGHHPKLAHAINHLLSSGGKRIRPTIALLAGGMLQADHDRLVTLAAAVEMLHTATLVHDDLIDKSILRRGLPTLNAQWTTGATVLTGDYLFARAADLATQVESLPLVSRFSGSLMTIVNGEITQLFPSAGDNPREDYFRRIFAKTAALFEMAAEGPAILCDADEDDVLAMRTYGHNIGIAFQIVDDILDFIADPKQVGKPTASDLRQGLITLPALNYLESKPDDKDLVALMNNGHLGGQNIERLIEAISTSGAIEKSLQEAATFTEDAVKQLMRFPAGLEREALVELAEYVVQRTS